MIFCSRIPFPRFLRYSTDVCLFCRRTCLPSVFIAPLFSSPLAYSTTIPLCLFSGGVAKHCFICFARVSFLLLLSTPPISVVIAGGIARGAAPPWCAAGGPSADKPEGILSRVRGGAHDGGTVGGQSTGAVSTAEESTIIIYSHLPSIALRFCFHQKGGFSPSVRNQIPWN